MILRRKCFFLTEFSLGLYEKPVSGGSREDSWSNFLDYFVSLLDYFERKNLHSFNGYTLSHPVCFGTYV